MPTSAIEARFICFFYDRRSERFSDTVFPHRLKAALPFVIETSAPLIFFRIFFFWHRYQTVSRCGARIRLPLLLRIVFSFFFTLYLFAFWMVEQRASLCAGANVVSLSPRRLFFRNSS